MLALILVMIAMPLQLLGYSSTCTTGDDKPFVSGALLSALPLLAAVYVLSRHWSQRKVHLFFEPLAGLVSVALLALTSEAWLNVVRFGMACGANYKMRDEMFDLANVLILFSYLVLPGLIALISRPWLIKFARDDVMRSD